MGLFEERKKKEKQNPCDCGDKKCKCTNHSADNCTCTSKKKTSPKVSKEAPKKSVTKPPSTTTDDKRGLDTQQERGAVGSETKQTRRVAVPKSVTSTKSSPGTTGYYGRELAQTYRPMSTSSTSSTFSPYGLGYGSGSVTDLPIVPQKEQLLYAIPPSKRSSISSSQPQVSSKRDTITRSIRQVLEETGNKLTTGDIENIKYYVNRYGDTMKVSELYLLIKDKLKIR